MSLHFGNNEYTNLIGRTVGVLSIKNIESSPDEVYSITDGYAGNAYLLTLENGETFNFRSFQEVVNKYGALKKVEPV